MIIMSFTLLALGSLMASSIRGLARSFIGFCGWVGWFGNACWAMPMILVCLTAIVRRGLVPFYGTPTGSLIGLSGRVRGLSNPLWTMPVIVMGNASIVDGGLLCL